MAKLDNVQEVTYFIIRNEEDFNIESYGEMQVGQYLETIHPIVDTYTDKSEWETILESAGIVIEKQPV